MQPLVDSLVGGPAPDAGVEAVIGHDRWEEVLRDAALAVSVAHGEAVFAELAGYLANRPHLHYVDGRYRGYFILDLTRQRLQADFYSVATVAERSTQERFEKGFMTESGRNHLVEVSSPA